MRPLKSLKVPGTLADGSPRHVEVHHYANGQFMVSILSRTTSLKSVITAESAEKIRQFLAGEAPEPEPVKTVTVNWDLYKPSGKWAYGGQATFPQPRDYLTTPELLTLIAANQTDVTPNCIVDGNYTVIIKETAECMSNPAYQGFLCRMVPHKAED